MRLLPNSEIESETQQERAIARQLRVKIQRVQVVVLVGEVQQPYDHLGLSPRETVARVEVELPEIVPWQGRVIVVIGLLPPQRLGLSKPAPGMVEDRMEIERIQDGGMVRVRKQCLGQARIARLEIGLADPVAGSERPVAASELA